jgi:hypothetical protein
MLRQLAKRLDTTVGEPPQVVRVVRIAEMLVKR